jgi:hypothetical protein
MTLMSTTQLQFTPTKNINTTIKKCVNCVNFRYPKPYSATTNNIDNIHHFGQCKVFGFVDPVTGAETYMVAHAVRASPPLCSYDATYYQEKLEE